MSPDVISPDLKTMLRRLKLSKILDTLPDRLTGARQQKMPHQDFLLLVLSDEVARRDSLAATLRAQRGHLDPDMQLERWDAGAAVTYDQPLLNELCSLRFLDTHAHVSLVGPVGVGKTFLAHALGHIATRRGHSVLAVRADRMLKTLKHARLDHTHEQELRKLLAADLLIIDDFFLDAMDSSESRDAYDILSERDQPFQGAPLRLFFSASSRAVETWVLCLKRFRGGTGFFGPLGCFWNASRRTFCANSMR